MNQLRAIVAFTLLAFSSISNEVVAAPPASNSTAPAASNALPVDAAGDPLPSGALGRVGTNRFRNGGYVYKLAYLPKIDRIVTASGGNIVTIWRPDGARIASYKIPDKFGSISHLAATPDGLRIAVSTAGDAIFLVNRNESETPQLLREFGSCNVVRPPSDFRPLPDKPESYSVGLSFTADESRLIRVRSNEINVWNLATAKVESTHALSHVLGYCPKTDEAAIQNIASEFEIWSLKGKKRLRTIPFPEGAGDGYVPSYVRLSPGGEYLSLNIRDSRHCIISTNDGKKVLDYQCFQNVMSFAHDGRLFSALNTENECCLWDLAHPGKPIRKWKTNYFPQTITAMSSDRIAISFEDTVSVFSDKTAELQYAPRSLRMDRGFTQLSDPKLALCDRSVVDIATGKIVWRSQYGVRKITVTERGIFGVDKDANLYSFRVADGKPTLAFNIREALGEDAEILPKRDIPMKLHDAMRFSANGRYLLLFATRMAAVIDLSTGHKVGSTQFESGRVARAEISPFGDRVAIGWIVANGVMRVLLWAPANASEQSELVLHEYKMGNHPSCNLAFTSGQRFLIVAMGTKEYSDGLVDRRQSFDAWEVATGLKMHAIADVPGQYEFTQDLRDTEGICNPFNDLRARGIRLNKQPVILDLVRGHVVSQYEIPPIYATLRGNRLVVPAEDDDGAPLIVARPNWRLATFHHPYVANRDIQKDWEHLGENSASAQESFLAIAQFKPQELRQLAMLLKEGDDALPAAISALPSAIGDYQSGDIAVRAPALRKIQFIELRSPGSAMAEITRRSPRLAERVSAALSEASTVALTDRAELQRVRVEYALSANGSPEAIDLIKQIARAAPESPSGRIAERLLQIADDNAKP